MITPVQVIVQSRPQYGVVEVKIKSCYGPLGRINVWPLATMEQKPEEVSAELWAPADVTVETETQPDGRQRIRLYRLKGVDEAPAQ